MNFLRQTTDEKRAARQILQVIVMVLPCIPWMAYAAEIYLNGTKITGQKNIDFGKAEVQIDTAGDIRIHAPGYEVKELEVTPAAKPADPSKSATKPAKLNHDHFIVSEISQPGVTGYDVQLIINNRFIQDLSDRFSQNVVDINHHLTPGRNTISFRAKRQGREAKTNNKSDSFTLVVGIGQSAGDQLTIEKVLAEFKVSAADFGEKAQSFTIDAK